MLSAMPEAAEAWAADHPDVMGGIGECRKYGLIVPVFSSQRAKMGAMACGVSTHDPHDVDVRTPDFWKTVDILGAEVEEDQLVSVPTGDERTMRVRAHRALARLGSDVVEFMLLLGPVRIDDLCFPSGFTPGHIDGLTIYQTDLGPLPVDDEGTWEVYSLRQGKGEKRDLGNAALVLATTTPDKYHAFMRQAASDATDRMTRFQREVATAARQIVHDGVLLTAAAS